MLFNHVLDGFLKEFILAKTQLNGENLESLDEFFV